MLVHLGATSHTSWPGCADANSDANTDANVLALPNLSPPLNHPTTHHCPALSEAPPASAKTQTEARHTAKADIALFHQPSLTLGLWKR